MAERFRKGSCGAPARARGRLGGLRAAHREEERRGGGEPDGLAHSAVHLSSVAADRASRGRLQEARRRQGAYVRRTQRGARRRLGQGRLLAPRRLAVARRTDRALPRDVGRASPDGRRHQTEKGLGGRGHWGQWGLWGRRAAKVAKVPTVPTVPQKGSIL